jgi:hypothetical protein
LEIGSNPVYTVSGSTTNGNCVEFGAGHILADTGSPCGSGGGGGGSVTSVGLNLPSSIFAVSGTPVTTSGVLTGTLQTQSANTVFAGPSSGAAAAPTFRSLTTADLPTSVSSGVVATGSTQGTAAALTASVNVINTVASGTGVIDSAATNIPVRVLNRGANVLNFYPPSGAQIESFGTNNPVIVAVGGSTTVLCISSTQCWSY